MGLKQVSSKKKSAQVVDEVDIALVGAGIMSATLGAMLRELEPSWSQMIFERLDAPAEESSSCLLYTSPSPRDRV